METTLEKTRRKTKKTKKTKKEQAGDREPATVPGKEQRGKWQKAGGKKSLLLSTMIRCAGHTVQGERERQITDKMVAKSLVA